MRVVFDASCKASSGLSLNDISYTGPVIQQDLFSIIVRFRTHNYVLIADIEKMYRQILIHPSQHSLQLVLWRERPEDNLKTYSLNTVTYGTRYAPYAATKTICKLAEDERISFPIAAEVAKRDFYMDDFMSGSNTLEEARELQHQMSELMKRGGFKLRKWNSNSKELLSYLPVDDLYTQKLIPLDQGSPCKTLGLIWDQTIDSFRFSINPIAQEFTKRKVLSCIAQIFDPLGLLGPVIVKAKIFMQKIWLQCMDWDEDLPELLKSEWTSFRSTLNAINDLSIPRQITCFEPAASIEIHGFSDASISAYGACLYIRCKNIDGQITVQLIASKSRVAPIKTISLPRLELSGALLLTQLVQNTVPALNINISNIYYWTDSTIVLNWLSAPACTWNTFVSNRVAIIQDASSIMYWRHVRSNDNPADLISRGVFGNQLNEQVLWWKGPQWLSEEEDFWKNSNINLNNEELNSIERKPIKTISCNLINNTSVLTSLIDKISIYIKLVRIVAYLLRYMNNLRHKTSDRRNSIALHTCELQQASIKLLKIMQAESFAEDIKSLTDNGCVKKDSKLYSLCPFLDNNNLLRVGGRLSNSQLTSDEKYPILLSDKHRLTKLLVTYEHQRLLHAGPQSLLNTLRQNKWKKFNSQNST